MAENKKDQTRIDVAKKIRGFINRNIPNEENAKRKAAAFMNNLENSMPTMENAQRKADAFLKKVGAGKFSRASQNAIKQNAKSTEADAAKARAKRTVKDKVASTPTAQQKADVKRVAAATKARKADAASKSKEPSTIAEAKRMGKSYFIGRDGKKKAAVTAEDLKKSGHKNLQAYLNAKGKKAKK